MKLIELLEVINENLIVKVLDTNYNLLTWYDGRNSIDTKYNNCQIVEVSTDFTNTIIIIVK